MLAARDQENLVYGQQQAAATKPLNQNNRVVMPKTPGNRYPKTPLNVRLHDENEQPGFVGGKSVLNTKGKGLEIAVTGAKKGAAFDKNAFVTPIGPRNRAPLGMKTTNAKTKVLQTPADSLLDKDLQKIQARPTSARRPKARVLHAETVKLDIHSDENGPLEEREVEYCPPRPKDLPYESDVFPDGCLDYEILKGPNLMRGWQNYYLNPVDENGVSLKEKAFEEARAKALKDGDERILKAIDEQEWTVSDVPETFANRHLNTTTEQLKEASGGHVKKGLSLTSRGPATITARKAASTLSAVPNAPVVEPKIKSTAVTSKSSASFLSRSKKPSAPAPINPSTMRHTAAAAASRSTIGYTKGRNASSVLNMRTKGLPRSTSNLSAASDTTITPASYAQQQGPDMGEDEWKKLKFLGAFDTDDEDLEPGLRGVLPECLRRGDDVEEDFVFTLPGM